MSLGQFLRRVRRRLFGNKGTKALRGEVKSLRKDVARLRGAIAQLREDLVVQDGRLIRDRHRRENGKSFEKYGVGYPVEIKRFALAQRRILERIEARGSLRFLDAGGRDGQLKELIKEPLTRELFDRHVTYTGMDLTPGGENVLVGDVCSDQLLVAYPSMLESFDIVYSNNVFEHLVNPFAAMKNLHRLLAPGGMAIINAPFAWRYHEVPQDYFRYTHTGLIALLTVNGITDFRVLDSGYDISGRRRNLNGLGEHNGSFQNDVCPEDDFGAWRENWQAVLIYEKLAAVS